MSPSPLKRKIQLIRHLPPLADAPVALAIGNFDGLHLGHKAVIDTMLDDARAQQLIPAILTFHPHPRRYFQPDAPAFQLESLSQRLHRLAEWGVARVFMPSFDAHFAALDAAAFLQHILQQSISAQTVVTGDDFAFGKGRAGSTAMLQQWGAAQHIRVHTVPAVLQDDSACSSSAIRAAIKAGNMPRAAAMLGRHYTIRSFVRHGDKRGRTIGFPTANFILPEAFCLPAYGVYAVQVTIEGAAEQSLLHGVANLGMRPTIGQQLRPTLEVHLFDFSGDLYGKRLNVAFIAQLRPEKKFDSLDALKAQIAADVAAAKTLLD